MTVAMKPSVWYRLLGLLLLQSVISKPIAGLPPAFSYPKSEAYDHVNLLIGNGGDTPNGSGGMIPSTGPPFAMTRWVAQTHQNYVSVTPYNWTADRIHGFQATRQPAIWMGESGSVAVIPGVSRGDVKVKTDFEERGLKMRKESEIISPAYYSVVLEDGLGGEIMIEQSSTSRVGHLRFTFTPQNPTTDTPYIILESSRPSVVTSSRDNVTFPHGTVNISPSSSSFEICGSNSERQDHLITPISIRANAQGFRGYYCAQFHVESDYASLGSYGIVQNSTMHPGRRNGQGPLLSGYITFPFVSYPDGQRMEKKSLVVTVRIGTSFISTEQARRNIAREMPDPLDVSSNKSARPQSLETTSRKVREAWTEKLDRFQIETAGGHGADVDIQKEVFWTGVVHALQYPSEQYEYDEAGRPNYYSGYDNKVHAPGSEESYTGYSIWDTYRAEWAFLILFAPERVPGMIRSMLNDYQEGGWLPMWKNIVETNIMVGTHADSLIAEAIVKGVQGFDTELAWEAVWKDATIPPKDDATTQYFDREENVDYEVRAGLSTVYASPSKGWVADDIHSESASRTLDYAYDDYAAYRLAVALSKPEKIASLLLGRSLSSPFTLFNEETGFMEARNRDGSWAGEDNGWTEGDKWAYSFDVVHDIPRLIAKRGGNESFVRSLDQHFDGGHNDHTNEPSHHIPYLYALAGVAYKTQERVREIAKVNYNNTPNGLSGNEDCGQMSAWYIFSAMGFYPVNPVSGEYVVGSPFFDRLTINLPPNSAKHEVDGPRHQKQQNLLIIRADGARTKPYIKSLTVNGKPRNVPIIYHEDIAHGGEIVFEMSDKVEAWGNSNPNPFFLLQNDGGNRQTTGSHLDVDHSEL